MYRGKIKVIGLLAKWVAVTDQGFDTINGNKIQT